MLASQYGRDPAVGTRGTKCTREGQGLGNFAGLRAGNTRHLDCWLARRGSCAQCIANKAGQPTMLAPLHNYTRTHKIPGRCVEISMTEQPLFAHPNQLIARARRGQATHRLKPRRRGIAAIRASRSGHKLCGRIQRHCCSAACTRREKWWCWPRARSHTANGSIYLMSPAGLRMGTLNESLSTNTRIFSWMPLSCTRSAWRGKHCRLSVSSACARAALGHNRNPYLPETVLDIV